MFLAYIETHSKSVLGIPFTDPLLVWFRNFVEPLESMGTNNALKHRPGAVRPRLSLENAVSKISYFTDVDDSRTKSRVAYEFSTHSPHMQLPATSWLTTTAEKIINNLQDIKHKYAIHQPHTMSWLCTRNPDFLKPLTNFKYPIFKRIRRIV